MTIIEAMGTGLPIVASAVGGVPDMLEDNVSGMLVPCDPEQTAQAVQELLDKLPQGLFTFCALPLRYENADGSPIRAVAILED